MIPGENGWLIPAGSVDALAAALEELLACPADALTGIDRLSLGTSCRRHSIDIEAAKLAALFRTSSAGHGGQP